MKLIYLTNIPTPYRIKRFNTMVPIFREEGIEFEVWFMARNEKNRNWNIDYSSIKFNYKIWPGIHPAIGGFFAHFNPGLLLALKREKYDIAVIAGMASPTTWLAKPFLRKEIVRIMSVETNLLGKTVKSGLKKIVKEKLLKGYDGYQVTGPLQIDYVNYFCPSSTGADFVTLPNLIDNEIFNVEGKKADLRSYGIDTDKLICLMPHRIVDFKIPQEFFEAVKESKNTHFIIIGKGSDVYEATIRNLIKQNNLPITIIPFAQQSEMATLYRAADYFCLPSKEDPSPLSPIEAIASGLPIIVSDRIGNRPDVLDENGNGFSFDPYSAKSCADAIAKIEALAPEEMKKMRDASLNRYNERFNNEACLRRYAQGLKSIVKHKYTK